MKRIQPDGSLEPVESLRETTHSNKQTAHMRSAVGIVRIQCHRLLVVAQAPRGLLSVPANIAKQHVDAIIGAVERQRLSRQFVGALQGIIGRIIPATLSNRSHMTRQCQ